MKYLILLFALSGCSTVEQITTRDGKPLYQASCQSHSGMGECYKLATKTCNGEYSVQESGGNILDDYFMIFACKN